MAWTTPLTAVANAILTDAQWNASVRDNLNETAVAKASASGQIFASTGVNALAARTPNADSTATSESTTSTSFTDLATSGPSLTLTTGTKALVALHTRMTNNTSGGITRCGWTVSGASTVAASDTLAAAFESSAANDNIWCSGVWIYTGLTPGSNTITMKYKVDAGTGTFSDRRLSVIPF